MQKFQKLIRTLNDFSVVSAIKNNWVTTRRKYSLKDLILKNKNITLTKIFNGRRKAKSFIFTSGLMITSEDKIAWN
jgi:hypothetical protein